MKRMSFEAIGKVLSGLSATGLVLCGILYYINMANVTIAAYGPVSAHLIRIDMLKYRYFLATFGFVLLLVASRLLRHLHRRGRVKTRRRRYYIEGT